ESAISEELQRYIQVYADVLSDQAESAQELLINSLLLRNAFFSALSRTVSNFEVYQISPATSRQPGVPTPNPGLSTAGENLPALVDWLKRKHPKHWESVMTRMQDILPGLTDITVQYLHTKAL